MPVGSSEEVGATRSRLSGSVQTGVPAFSNLPLGASRNAMVEMTTARTPTRATGGDQNIPVIGMAGIIPTAIRLLPTFR